MPDTLQQPTVRRHRHALLWLAGLVLAASPPAAHAGGGPENVAVVVNDRSWASLAVANEFVRLRAIPPGHVTYLADVPGFEEVGVNEFRDRILKPALRAIEARGLVGQIDYLVYSCDFPYAVNVNADIGNTKPAQVLTQPAAITGLTYLYPLTLSGTPSYLGLQTNLYMRNPIPPKPDAPWAPADAKRLNDALRTLDEIKAARRRRADEAAKAAAPGTSPPAAPAEEGTAWNAAAAEVRALAGLHPNHASLRYNLACLLAQEGHLDQALAELREALACGWWDPEHTRQDPDLAPVRGLPEFDALVQAMGKVEVRLQPTRGFRGQYGWNAAGEVVPSGQGIRYLLSTMLSVTSGRGLSVTEALASLRRSAAADATRPAGTVYYLTNGDIRAKVRAPLFHAAATLLRAQGVKAEVLEGVLPQGKSDVAGAMVGTADFLWQHSGSTILPGAICEHLTSTGGVLHYGGGQSPLTEFLRQGAAGASGTVTEPFAITAKFPSPFLHVHYAQGCTLAEAFYQSVAGPYQLLIVGDPLCRPWAQPPLVSLNGLRPDATVRGRVSFQPVALSASGHPVAAFELFLDGRRFAVLRPGQSATLDTAPLPDGSHELRVVAVAGDAVETRGQRALRITVANATPPPRLTLRAAADAVPLDADVAVTFAGAPERSTVVLQHNTRPVGTGSGSTGTISVPAARLGLGTVDLHGIATVPGAPPRQICSAPLAVTVVAPPLLPALSSPPFPAGSEPAPGLLLTPRDGPPRAVKSLVHNWQSDARLAPGTPFTLEGWVEMGENALAQLQVAATQPDAPALFLNGRRLDLPAHAGWRYLPLHLAKGWHRLSIEGAAGPAARLDVRFGVAGTRPLDEVHFRHLAPPLSTPTASPSPAP